MLDKETMQHYDRLMEDSYTSADSIINSNPHIKKSRKLTKSIERAAVNTVWKYYPSLKEEKKKIRYMVYKKLWLAYGEDMKPKSQRDKNIDSKNNKPYDSFGYFLDDRI